MDAKLNQLLEHVERELTGSILPFHMYNLIDRENGGFFGRLTNEHEVDFEAPKGLVQVTRLLWTYSRAYRLIGKYDYFHIAQRAYQELTTRFLDPDHQGYYWSISADGIPQDRAKMIYGQAFAIYGLSEFYCTSRHAEALDQAIALFRCLEHAALDPVNGGYWEACTADWRPNLEIAVDSVPFPVSKSMNTHLHLLEAYTNLYRVWPDAGLKDRISALLHIHIDRIFNPFTGHLQLHFDARWRTLNRTISYGHDIEASWLMWEAAEVIDSPALLEEIKPIVLTLADTTLSEGFDHDGGLFEEGGPAGVHNFEKHWWPQAEALVGFTNAYQITQERKYLPPVLNAWKFIRTHLADSRRGEWFWGVDRTGSPLPKEKAGMWKTPYHNGRACFELMDRLPTIL